MGMLKPPFFALLLFIGMGLASPGQAALVARLGGQAVYDTDLNITWLANANVNGKMTWYAAMDWAAGLNVGGLTGWRLPTADTSCGWRYNCINSEMGHLFYTEGGLTQGQRVTDSVYVSNFFSNMQNHAYWSNTGSGFHAWYFATNWGIQAYEMKTYGEHYAWAGYYAWAVHDGDVAPPAVPEPEDYLMLLIGFGMVGYQVKRKQALRVSGG